MKSLYKQKHSTLELLIFSIIRDIDLVKIIVSNKYVKGSHSIQTIHKNSKALLTKITLFKLKLYSVQWYISYFFTFLGCNYEFPLI